MRSLLLAAVATALVLAGCTSREGGTPETESAAEPVDLAAPIEFRPVLTTGSPATTLPGDDGERLPLDEPIMTVDRLEAIEAKADQHGTGWLLELRLTDEDARTFGDWTTDHIGERLAMVAEDEVLMAPTIQSAITGGELQITSNYTKSEAEDVLAKITGR